MKEWKKKEPQRCELVESFFFFFGVVKCPLCDLGPTEHVGHRKKGESYEYVLCLIVGGKEK